MRIGVILRYFWVDCVYNSVNMIVQYVPCVARKTKDVDEKQDPKVVESPVEDTKAEEVESVVETKVESEDTKAEEVESVVETKVESEDTKAEEVESVVETKVGDTKETVRETAPKHSDQALRRVEERNRSNRGAYAALIAAVGVAAFFAGLAMPVLNQDPITMSDLDNAVTFLEGKIDTLSDELRELEDTMLTNPESNTGDAVVTISADDDPVMGDDNAPVIIIEFSDFQCPFCARFHAETLPLIKENYIDTGKVKFVYRDFPIQNIHPNAVPAAVASECAHEQDRYWEYHDSLFENINRWGPLGAAEALEEFKTYAVNLNLDEASFNECLDTGRYIGEVSMDYADGVSYEITSTPSFLIGNEQTGYFLISGARPYEQFQFAIEQILSTVSQ